MFGSTAWLSTWLWGTIMAFEVLASKAYGAGNHYLLGLYFKRGLLVLLLILSAFFLVSSFSDKIFILLGQNPNVTEYLQEYVTMVFPGICAFAIFSLRAIYLNSQFIFSIPIMIQIITTFAHVAWCSLFQDMRVQGIALAMNITFFSNMILLELYNLIFKPRKLAVAPWSWEVIKGFPSYLAFTSPIAFTTILEELSYEINSLIAGLLQSEVILAVHVALAHSGSLFYCLPEGFSAALNSLVGIAIGERKFNKAKRFAFMGVFGGMLIMLICCLVLFIFSMQWACFFVENEEIVETMLSFLPLFIGTSLLDSIQLTLGAVVKVVGKGKIALLMYVLCLYVIANPLSYILGIRMEMGLWGIWLGVISGVALLSVIFAGMCWKIKWDKNLNCEETSLLNDI